MELNTDFNTPLKPLCKPVEPDMFAGSKTYHVGEKPKISPTFHAAECKWAALNARKTCTPQMAWGSKIHSFIPDNATAIFGENAPKVEGFEPEQAEDLCKIFDTVQRNLAPYDPMSVYFEGLGLEESYMPEFRWEKGARKLAVVEFDRFILRFAVDAVVFADRKIIIDWKTGITDGNKKQLEAMALAFHKVCSDTYIDGMFVYVEKGFPEKFTFGPDDWGRIERELEESANIKAMGPMAPRQINQWCKGCADLSSCPLMRQINFAIPEILPPTRIEDIERIGIGLRRLKDHIDAAQEVASQMTEKFFEFLIAQEEIKEGPKKWEFGNLRASKHAGRYEKIDGQLFCMMQATLGRLECVKLGKRDLTPDEAEKLAESLLANGITMEEVCSVDVAQLMKKFSAMKADVEKIRKVSSWTHRITAHGTPEEAKVIEAQAVQAMLPPAPVKAKRKSRKVAGTVPEAIVTTMAITGGAGDE